ncbi:MAG: hypothetical protein JOY66_10715, partial [Acetobacteraceae bacterium]|nr:hypothetical protein [Acetobacteraceae bacterium]
RRRIDDLLAKIEQHAPTPEELRACRGIEVLERIGTPPARAVLEALADGAESAVLTREARLALARLTR